MEQPQQTRSEVVWGNILFHQHFVNIYMKCCGGMSKTFETAYLYLSFKNTRLSAKEIDTKTLKTVDIMKIFFFLNQKLLLKNISSLGLK